MFCANCYNEIPKGKSCYKHQDTNQHFCSLDCLTDWLIYSTAVTLEVSKGGAEVKDNTDE